LSVFKHLSVWQTILKLGNPLRNICGQHLPPTFTIG
jgi:hypothetical protein